MVFRTDSGRCDYCGSCWPSQSKPPSRRWRSEARQPARRDQSGNRDLQRSRNHRHGRRRKIALSRAGSRAYENFPKSHPPENRQEFSQGSSFFWDPAKSQNRLTDFGKNLFDHPPPKCFATSKARRRASPWRRARSPGWPGSPSGTGKPRWNPGTGKSRSSYTTPSGQPLLPQSGQPDCGRWSPIVGTISMPHWRQRSSVQWRARMRRDARTWLQPSQRRWLLSADRKGAALYRLGHPGHPPDPTSRNSNAS